MLKQKTLFKGVLVLVLSLSLLGLSSIPWVMGGSVPLAKSVAGWLPYWDQTRALAVVQSNPDVFDELSPFWYDLGSSGELVILPNSEDSSLISYANSMGKKLIPLISNEFQGSLVSNIINNPDLKQTHINNIVNKAVSMGYSGIDIDYENLLAADRDAYSAFIKELASALHNQGKLLTVTVHAKTSAPGTWSGPQAQDYVAIGQAADKVRIMAYDYHWSGSSAGSIAPASWVEQVVAYAVTAIPASKVVLGVPNYGYDWLGTQGKGLTYSQAMATAAAYGATVVEDAQNGPHYTYVVNGTTHEVWFENANSFATLLDIVNKYNINGIAIWRLGGEDPENYTVTRTKFAPPTTTTETSTGSTSGTSADTTTGTTNGTTTDGTGTSTGSAGTSSGTATNASAGTTAGTTTDTTTSTTTETNASPASGQTQQSEDTIPPSVSLAYTDYNNSLALSVNASDNTGIAKVEFYFDGTLIKTDYKEPYKAHYKIKRSGASHTLKAVAYDFAGNQASAEKIIKH